MGYVSAVGSRFPKMAMDSRVKWMSDLDPKHFSGKSGRYFISLIGFVIATAISSNAHATVSCTVNIPVITFQASPVLNSPQDLPIGKILSNWIETPLTRTHTNCVFSPQSDEGVGAKGTGVGLGTVTDGGATYQIFKSPTQGIGYILKGKDKHGTYVPIGRDFTRFIIGLSTYYDVQFSIRLVATGEPLVSGPVPSFQVAEIRVFQGATFSTPSLLFMPPTSVIATTCQVITGSIAFQLSAIRETNLPNVGSVGGAATKTIELNCKSATNVRMVISDATAPANRSSVLTLGPESTASGVGIQLLYKGNSVFYGIDSSAVTTMNQFPIGDNLLGTVSIPLTAQYIRTDSNLNPGTVRGLATFTMSYQ
jgi:type 1 fimbria pilin